MTKMPVIHFAPWGATVTPCGVTVPKSTRWEPLLGDFAIDEPYTARKKLTTCEDCAFEFTDADFTSKEPA